MNGLKKNSVGSATPHNRAQTQTRVLLLVLAGFVGGMAAGAFWLYRSNHGAASPAQVSEAPALSESTRAVLHHLKSPVELRFYSLLDPATVGQPVQAFAERVQQLLSQYEAEAGGKLRITNLNSAPDQTLQQAAAADGIKPFNLDKGDACYLGVALVGKTQKETLAELSPDWEPALECDLTRAIKRVANPPSALPVVKRDDTAALAAVKRTVPNVDSVSVQDASQRIREASVAEYARVAEEMGAKIKDAEQRLQAAQSSGAEAEQQAAMKQLRQLQAEQTEKLKQIAAQSHAQVEALGRLKANAQ